MLDRIDALLFAAPAFYVYLEGDAVKRLAILGSTGSIGQSALAVVAAHPERLACRRARSRRQRGAAGGAGARVRSGDRRQWARRRRADRLRAALGTACPRCRDRRGRTDRRGHASGCGHRHLCVIGHDGARAVLAAIDAGKTIALANKEVLVMAGELVMAAARRTRRRQSCR